MTFISLLGQEASSELIEVFDRVIGKNIDDLKPREVLYAFIGFTSITKATVRPKIQSLLLKRLSDSLEMLSVNELTALARTTSSNSNLQESLQLGDFVLSRAELLTEQDLRHCLKAFN